MKRLFIAVLMLPLAGCMTAEERYAQDASFCGSIAPPGSPSYADCMIYKDAAYQQRRMAASQTLMNVGANLMTQGR
jgi:hypothetical protein